MTLNIKKTIQWVNHIGVLFCSFLRHKVLTDLPTLLFLEPKILFRFNKKRGTLRSSTEVE